jgi:hypothetical protein
MEAVNYSNDVAGMKTQWIIRFDGVFPHPYGEEKSKPRVELLFPSPINKDRWLVVNLEKNKGEIQTIERFQKMCDEAKLRVQDNISFSSEQNSQNTASSQEIENFAQLLLYFNEVMRHLRKKDTDTPEK